MFLQDSIRAYRAPALHPNNFQSGFGSEMRLDWILMSFRNQIEQLIRTNSETNVVIPYKMIEKLV